MSKTGKRTFIDYELPAKDLEGVRGGNSEVTTLALGEEGGTATTKAVGEECGSQITTQAVGEECGSAS